MMMGFNKMTLLHQINGGLDGTDHAGKTAVRITQLAALGISTISAGVFGYLNANSAPVSQEAFSKVTIETVIESAVAYTGINALMRAAGKSGALERALGLLSGACVGAGKAAIYGVIGYGIGYGIGMMTR